MEVLAVASEVFPVIKIGGLADTVIDASPMALATGVATGLQFAPVSAEMLRVAIQRMAALYADPPTWRKIQANGIACGVSWDGQPAITPPCSARLFRRVPDE